MRGGAGSDTDVWNTQTFIFTIVKVFVLGWFEKSSNRRGAQSSGLTMRSRLVDCICGGRISGDFRSASGASGRIADRLAQLNGGDTLK